MAKRNIMSATNIQKRLKELSVLKEEVKKFREESDELRKEVAELRSALSIMATKILKDGTLIKGDKNTKADLGDDTWDPSAGPMPKKMKPDKKFHVSVKKREGVRTVEKGGYE
jgi:hypothetical protein